VTIHGSEAVRSFGHQMVCKDRYGETVSRRAILYFGRGKTLNFKVNESCKFLYAKL